LGKGSLGFIGKALASDESDVRFMPKQEGEIRGSQALAIREGKS